jgi:hypothetical protein
MKRLVSALLSVILFISVVGIFPVYAADTGIVSVEVTQVMGKGVDMATGKYYFMNTFVANKPATIQVVMDESYSFTNADSITVSRDGREITKISPDKSEKAQIMTFTPGKSDVDSWAAGRYKFTANIGGESHSTEAIFNESREFSVLAVGASVKYKGTVYSAPKMDANTVTLRAQAIPVSENKLIRRYLSAPISFGTGENGYDLSEPGSQLRFLSDIENYRLKSAANYDVVVVVVDSYISDNQQNGGYTDTNHAVVLSLKALGDAESVTTSFLHELGHIFGNGDEYVNGDAKPDVNGLPYGVSATNSNGEAVTGNREYFTHAPDNNYSGIMLNAAQNPYNPKSGGVMLNTSSFMGSSYSHWTTSMVWEEAYEKLIPNYQNVLPKVYTDGTLVPERNLDNTLSETDLQKLRDEWYAMCNDVHVAKGHKPYEYDKYFKAAEAYFQKAAEDTMKKGEDFMEFDINNAFRGPFKMYAVNRASDSYIYEWTSGELENYRAFFENSPCGESAMAYDYLVIAFMQVGGRTYFTWMDFMQMEPLPDTSDVVEPQPETPPVLEVNPVDNELPVDETARQEPQEPATQVPATQEPATQETTAGEPESEPGIASTNGLPAFEDYTEDMKHRILIYDSFDIGLSGIGSYDDEPYLQWDNAAAYLAWWAGQEYGVELTGDDIKDIYEQADANGDVGQSLISDIIVSNLTKPAADALPAFEDYTEEMKDRMLHYDNIDIGMSGAGLHNDEPYLLWDNVSAYFGWWAGQEFGTELSGDDVKNLSKQAAANEDIGQYFICDLVANYFGKQILVDEDGNFYVGDGDIEDPDGEW